MQNSSPIRNIALYSDIVASLQAPRIPTTSVALFQHWELEWEIAMHYRAEILFGGSNSQNNRAGGFGIM